MLEQPRAELDAAVAGAFKKSHGLHGSPRIHVDLQTRVAGRRENRGQSMARQGLVARSKKRRKNLTRPDKRAVPFPDLVKRDFTAPAPNVKWVGDMTEIPTAEGKLYLSTALDLFSRRLLGYAISTHADAELAGETIKMAVTARGGKQRVAGVIFHSDRGSTYTAHDFTTLCGKLGITQSMGRTGSCFDNAAAESSSPPWNTKCSPGIISRLEKKRKRLL